MSVNFTVIDTNGEILRSGVCLSDEVSTQAGIGEEALELKSRDDIHWIDPITKERQDKTDPGIILDKVSIISDGIDTAVLSNLPLNITVFIDDVPFVVADGTLNFTATSPGEYHFQFNEIQYLEKEWFVNAS